MISRLSDSQIARLFALSKRRPFYDPEGSFMKSNVPNPVSLFLCDEVIHDSKSGKTHVLGMFDAIRTHSFPHQQARVGIFVALTGKVGSFEGRVQCLDPDGAMTFETLPRNLRLSQRRPVLRVFFRILQARFRRPGIYRMQFVCEDHVLTEQPVVVLSKQGNGDA
jgi:uncharacterized protein DUF6941